MKIARFRGTRFKLDKDDIHPTILLYSAKNGYVGDCKIPAQLYEYLSNCDTNSVKNIDFIHISRLDTYRREHGIVPSRVFSSWEESPYNIHILEWNNCRFMAQQKVIHFPGNKMKDERDKYY